MTRPRLRCAWAWLGPCPRFGEQHCCAWLTRPHPSPHSCFCGDKERAA